VGTYLTEAGETGAAALARVATALTAPDPRAAREALIGHYALVARNGDRVVAMADPIATHDLFLRRSGGGMALATFLSDMLIGGAVGEIDEVAALRAAYLGEAGLAGRTILPGVRSLRGHEWLEGDLGRRDADRWTVRGAPPGPTAPWPDMDAALQGYAHETGRVFGALAGIGPVAINVTGGLDSRLAAAAARAAGIEPRLLYGRGDSRMTNTRAEDLAVVRRAARL
jgi:asparagine synthetase B (glutamine-hydrolysing)